MPYKYSIIVIIIIIIFLLLNIFYIWLRNRETLFKMFSYVSCQIPFTYKISLWGGKEMKSDIPDKNCFSTFNPPSEDLKVSYIYF